MPCTRYRTILYILSYVTFIAVARPDRHARGSMGGESRSSSDAQADGVLRQHSIYCTVQDFPLFLDYSALKLAVHTWPTNCCVKV